MRTSVKYRLLCLIIMACCFIVGSQFTPASLSSNSEKYLLSAISAVYFIFIPLCYWYCIIYQGGQKLWKMLVVLSLSSLVARLTYPTELAAYFEFVTWLRFPVIAVLLVIQLYLIVTVVRGLFNVRKAEGDPRVSAVETYGSQEKKLTLAIIMASEVTNWLYSVPWFSRKQPKAIANIALTSGARWHVWLMVVACLCLALMSYYLLAGWSELVAIVVASIIGYTLMGIVANHRLSRYYSLYILRKKLIINNALWGFLVVDLANIEHITEIDKKLDDHDKPQQNNILTIGNGDANIFISFHADVIYHGAMGQLPEPISQVYLSVDKPAQFIEKVNLVRVAN